MKILNHLFLICELRYPSKLWLAETQPRIFDIHADLFCGENEMGWQAKNEDGVVVSTPCFQRCLYYDAQVRKELEASAATTGLATGSIAVASASGSTRWGTALQVLRRRFQR